MGTMFFSNISSALALNPCESTAFHPPIYSLNNIDLVKTFYWDWGRDNNSVSENFSGTLNFTLQDVANNHSFSCSWGHRQSGYDRGYGYADDDWGWANCVDPATKAPLPMESRIVTLLNLNITALLVDRSLQTPVGIVQYWGCDVVNGSYPWGSWQCWNRVLKLTSPREWYQARADIFLDISCPQMGTRDSTVPCNANTRLHLQGTNIMGRPYRNGESQREPDKSGNRRARALPVGC